MDFDSSDYTTTIVVDGNPYTIYVETWWEQYNTDIFQSVTVEDSDIGYLKFNRTGTREYSYDNWVDTYWYSFE